MPRSPISLALLALLACGGERQARAAADSALLEDLQLAMTDAAPITFGDTAIGAPVASPAPIQVPAPALRGTAARRTTTPAPTPARAAERETVAPPASAPASTPTPAPELARARGIGAGAVIALATTTDVCTSHRPGDRLVGTVRETVIGEDGTTIPAGSRAVVEVASVSHGTNGAAPVITFRVIAVQVGDERVGVRGAVASADTLVVRRTTPAGTDAKRVIGGAVAGAVIGQVLGNDTRSTVIGAAAGAAAGTATARRNETVEACLPAGSGIRLTLAEPVVIGKR